MTSPPMGEGWSGGGVCVCDAPPEFPLAQGYLQTIFGIRQEEIAAIRFQLTGKSMIITKVLFSEDLPRTKNGV